MNTVKPLTLRKKFAWTGRLGNLIGTHFKDKKSAFIGTVGFGDDETLYLVTYACISQANTPCHTWSALGCSVKVIRFVDVDISIVEREEN
ncbi:hypothetical protein LCGC14_2741370 [marine sediment metagenome]|uniref:Uncharacterized protein n=1 Tax=marine sediment metagenome TaxID=412755 RepID=A0A0F8ZRI0_9ZZZZ